MQFGIFHTYREIARLAQSYPLFGAEFLFVLATGAVFLPNHWLGSNASVTVAVLPLRHVRHCLAENGEGMLRFLKFYSNIVFFVAC